MTTHYRTRDLDMLDDICWRYYGRRDVVPQVLEANPHLAQRPPVLEAGLLIRLPDLPLPLEEPVIRIWS
jgi:phage tail protein X